METEITKMLGIRYPILAAPMFLVSTPKIMAEVGEAGGLGCMPSLNCRTSAEFRDAVRETKKLTKAPFGINLVIKMSGRLQEDLEICLQEGVRLIITSLGDPTELVRAAKAKGTFVFSDVINMRHSKKVEAAGVDAVIAVSAGAGGHAGAITPFVLIPWLKANLKIPVVASGAIADGKGLAAALALGAGAGYIGTRFIATHEAPVEKEYKEMILRASPEDIEYTKEVSGTNANFLKESLEQFRAGKASGAWKNVWSAGHNVGLISEIKGCRQVVEEMVSEYGRIVEKLPRLQHEKAA
ncbi:MAG: nitronate monooxygenase [Bdellovibrionota bacterium]